jgi:Gluconate 2-dehydrogenase subunit 3
MRRREFILIPAKALSGLVLSSLLGEFVPAATQDTVKVPCGSSLRRRRRMFRRLVNVSSPVTKTAPGATEAGVVIYIDRQLAGPYARDKYRYTKGPWMESVPEHGYQGKETPQQIYRTGIDLLGDDFAAVPPDQQELRLEKIQDSHFFLLMRAHTIEGMFCDPLHGGNIGMVGWKMIGFPGPRMSYRSEIDKYHGKAFSPSPKSLEQILRHPVKAVEDEKS